MSTEAHQLKPEVCSVHAPPAQERAETRTRWVVYITAVMMVAELFAGYASHSLALTADGWHMMTHVGALGLSALAYWYARTRAHEERFAFGTGKVYALAGFSSSALLLAVAGLMIYSAIDRLLAPEDIKFAEAMSVAVIGLLVNFASALLLSGGGQEHTHSHAPGEVHDHHDHNLRSAYVHVIADALTSVLAIVAIAGSAFLHWRWLDPAVAILGAVIILQWCFKLLSETGRQLVDLDPSTASRDAVRAALEKLPDTRVCDLHLWRVGPGKLVCVVAVLAKSPLPLDDYKKAVYAAVSIAHLTVEVRPGVIDYRLPGDDAVFQALNGIKQPLLDGAMIFITNQGVLFGVMVMIWVIASLRQHAVRPLLQATIALTLTDRIGAAVLKPWFDRVRPCYILAKSAVRQLVDIGHGPSMPSLHAADSFAVAVAITLCWPASGRILLPLALLIAVSRVFVGVHWPSDVLAGIVFGALVATAVHFIGRRIGVSRDSAVVHS